MSTNSNSISNVLRSFQRKLLQKPHISTLKDINEGYCGVVAGEVYTRLEKPDDMNLCYAGTQADFHYWIEYEDTFYDVERPDGVNDWTELPFFRRHQQVTKFEYEPWVKQGY